MNFVRYLAKLMPVLLDVLKAIMKPTDNEQDSIQGKVSIFRYYFLDIFKVFPYDQLKFLIA